MALANLKAQNDKIYVNLKPHAIVKKSQRTRLCDKVDALELQYFIMDQVW